MHAQRFSRWLATATVAGIGITIASGQTVTLKARGAGTRSGTSSVTVTTQGSDSLATIKSSNADARTLFRDLAAKSGAKILLGPTAGGFITSTVDKQPIETAIRTVATAAGMSVRKIMVSKETAATLTADTAAPLAGALAGLSTNATVLDPATGRSVTLTFSTTTPKAEAGQTAVYFLLREQRARKNVAASGDAVKDAVANASSSLSELSTSDKFQAMQDLQRQLMDSMTPEERDAMRQNGGPGGPPPDGFGGSGPGGPPAGGMDGGGPPAPPQ